MLVKHVCRLMKTPIRKRVKELTLKINKKIFRSPKAVGYSHVFPLKENSTPGILRLAEIRTFRRVTPRVHVDADTGLDLHKSP